MLSSCPVSTLARVLDPEALDRAEGPRGRIAVDVLDAWLAAGDAIEIIVPPRVTCARCDGGGCDDCGRSGAHRLGGDELARTLRLSLRSEGSARNVIRLSSPLEAVPSLNQLWVEIRTAPEPSPFCRRVPRARARARGYGAIARAPALLVLVLAFALAVVALLARR